ncbi:hypothetical protein B5S28_g44 [[Candida] boidinii]|nr:hypothetical protein B5S28_g44 [[Candida] boidinii]OWB59243.1 hypothetical protein B5S29_g97 [[Candida] boidinii]
MQLNSLLTFLTLVISIVSAYQPEKSWLIGNYSRVVDLQKSYVKEKHIIEATNIDTKPIDKYYLAIPEEIEPYVTLVIPYLVIPKSESPILNGRTYTSDSDEEGSDSYKKLKFYEIDLPFPIAPKSKIRLAVTLVYTNAFKPFPEENEMGAEQTILFKTYKLPLAPYETLNFALQLTGAAKAEEVPINIPDDVKGLLPDLNYRVEKGSIVYGPYHAKFDAYVKLPMAIIFVKESPLPYVNKLKRDFWVSHWSNSYQLEEFYELTNNGVKLNKGFSRADYMLGKLTSRPSSIINGIAFPLPEEPTSEIYYTDLVGNVSTSTIRNNDLVIKPRFPIFGGWHYNFTIGWKNNLNDFLHNHPTNSNQYLLKVPLLNGMVDAIYDDVKLSVYLPEGAKLISVESPVDYEDMEVSKSFSFLDMNSGHSAVTLTYTNLVDEMRGLDIMIIYEYTLFDMLLKPLTTSFYVLIALLSLYLLKKIDLSIKTDEKKPIDKKEKKSN